ncbi:MAG: YlxM family DNA-binding protein [Cellulosilyticaceae bacterium]
MEKFLEVTYLYDFYQELLTQKQRDLLCEYYFDDLSLGELAIQHQISRQSVFDTIKKGEQKLLDYEGKLGLWKKYQRQEKILTDMKKIVADLQNDVSSGKQEDIQGLSTLLDQLTSEM